MELALLKECTYFHLIDFEGFDFKEISTTESTTPIANLKMEFKKKVWEPPDLRQTFDITLNGGSPILGTINPVG